MIERERERKNINNERERERENQPCKVELFDARNVLISLRCTCRVSGRFESRRRVPQIENKRTNGETNALSHVAIKLAENDD